MHGIPLILTRNIYMDSENRRKAQTLGSTFVESILEQIIHIVVQSPGARR